MAQDVETPDDSAIQTDALLFFRQMSGLDLASDLEPLPQLANDDATIESFAFRPRFEAEPDREFMEAIMDACLAEGLEVDENTLVRMLCPDDLDVDALFEEPPIFVVAEINTVVTVDPGGSFQFTWVLSRPGLDDYEGPEGDPNTGHSISLDIFSEGGDLRLGTTTFQDGEFGFEPWLHGIGFLGPNWFAFLAPADPWLDFQAPQTWVFLDDWRFVDTPWGSPLPNAFFGSPEFLATIGDNGEEPKGTTTTLAPEPEQPATTPAVEPEQEPQAEGEPAPEPISEPEDAGGVPVAAIAVGITAVAVLGLGAYAASRRRKGKCDELGDQYDEIHARYESAVAARGRAIDAESRAMTSGDEPALAEARAAISAAEQAEQELWPETQAAWNAYLDCVGGQMDDAHRPAPPRAPEPPATTPQTTVVTGAGAAAAVIASEEPVADVSDQPAGGATISKPPQQQDGVEWRHERSDGWQVPWGTVDIKISAATRAFFDWIQERGGLDGDPEYKDNMELEGSFSVEELMSFKIRGAQPLFQRPQRKYEVDLTVTVHAKQTNYECLREYAKDPGGSWVWTRRSRVEPLDDSDSPSIAKRWTRLPNGAQVARALNEVVTLVEDLNKKAGESLEAFDRRCSGG